MPATPAPIGSGPPHETCGSCAHSAVVTRAPHYIKCDHYLCRPHFASSNSDIGKDWPACRFWQSELPELQIIADKFAIANGLEIGSYLEFVKSQENLLVVADWLEDTGNPKAASVRCAAENMPPEIPF